ncbi:MAG: hypothetical protein ACO3SP_06750 [Ilumatobacteraceae bacterium]
MTTGCLQRAISSRTRNRLTSSFVIVAIGLWLTRNYWFPGRYMVGFDAYAYSGPNALVTAEAIRNWRLPLINEFIFGGVTHFGNPQAGVMYAPRLLTAFMETNRAMGYLVALHVVWLGLGMRFFLRRFAIGDLASTFSSVIMMMSGAVLTKALQFEQILVVAWLPWMLLAIHRLMDSAFETERRELVGRRVAQLAVVTAATCSAGHPQMTYEIAVASAFLVVMLVVGDRRRAVSWRVVRHKIVGLAAGVGLGALIIIPQLWASFVATRESRLARGRDLESLETSALALTIRASARSLFGSIRQVRPDLFVGSFEPVSYVGVVVVLLALLGFVSVGWGTSEKMWLYGFGAMGLFSAIMALGPRTFFFRIAFEFVPGFDLARVSARWLVIVTFVLCIAAAVGLEGLKNRPTPRMFAVFTSVAVIGLLFVLVVTELPYRFTLVSWMTLAILSMGAVAVASRTSLGPVVSIAVMMLALVETYSASTLWHAPVDPVDEPFTAVRSDFSEWLSSRDGYTIALTEDFGPAPEVIEGLRPNANVLQGIRSIDGYDGGVQVTERWATALSRFAVAPNPESPLRDAVRLPLDPDLAARTGIRFVVVDQRRVDPAVGIGWGAPIRSAERFDLYENPSWRGEARAWTAARAVAGVEIQTLLRDGNFDADVALVETESSNLPNRCRTSCGEVQLSAERENPERISIVGEFAQPSLVTFPVQVGPGWKASVDGVDSPMVPLDGLFVGTEVSAGLHTIVFEYRPGWLMPLSVIAVLSLILTLALMLPWSEIRRQRTERR